MFEVITSANKYQFADVLDEMFRARHRVFVEERGWEEVRRADGREIDEFDTDDTIYLVLVEDGRVRGGHRLLPTTAPHLFSQIFPEACNVHGRQIGPWIYEVGRTFVNREGLNQDEASLLGGKVMTGMMEFACRTGLEQYVGMIPVPALRRYLPLWDFKPLGVPMEFYGVLHVAVSTPPSKASLEACRRKFYLGDRNLLRYCDGDTDLEYLIKARVERPRRPATVRPAPQTLHEPIQETDIEIFERDGVVCLRNVLDPITVERLKIGLDALNANIAASPTGYDMTDVRKKFWGDDQTFEEDGTGIQYDNDIIAQKVREFGERPVLENIDDHRQGRFTLDTSTWLRNDVVREVALDSILPAIASKLLHSEKINFCDDQIFIKEPFTRERTAFHQDYPYFHLGGRKGCVMWICVDDADKESGVPVYVRGSHLWRRQFAANVFMAQTPMPGSIGDNLSDVEKAPHAYDIVQFDTKPGDIIIHHFFTVHGAGGNRTSRPRRALSLRYGGDDLRYARREGAPDQPHHFHDLKDGDPLDSRTFPVVWPRPYPGFSLARTYKTETLVA